LAAKARVFVRSSVCSGARVGDATCSLLPAASAAYSSDASTHGVPAKENKAMYTLYLIAALIVVGIPSLILLGSRGRTVDQRRRAQARPGGRRAGDPATL